MDGDALARRRVSWTGSHLVVRYWPSVLEAALDRVPSGGDRMLVGQAVRAGVHALLTRDRRVLACAHVLRPLGPAIIDPENLLELLASCGALLHGGAAAAALAVPNALHP